MAEEAGVSPGVDRRLSTKGRWRRGAAAGPGRAGARSGFRSARFLSARSATAADALRDSVRSGGFGVTLLDGVTGSGKTEVYFEAVAECIRRGKQALVLMPEIALTAQFLDRFAARFGTRPAEWHSQLSQRLRARTWLAVASGEVSVVVGARSALFLPYADLGLIVVDEEHDPAYKQEDGVHYHARDMAVVRARSAEIPIVLASATPSVETEVNARRGRYARVHLPERFGGQHLPGIEAIDLRTEGPPRGRFIAPRLAEAVKTAVERGEQALLFLNRRGYAPLTLCRQCGYRLACPNCDAWLVDHRFKRRLVCHHCGFANAAAGAMSAMPGGRYVRRRRSRRRAAGAGGGGAVSRQPHSGAVQRPGRTRSSACARNSTTSPPGRFDIVVGTQLVAKGHHFPKLNLVGIVDADLGLGNGDPRAAERTFQLLHQVVGRAGREAGQGIGYLQTHQPEHPVMRALIAADREAFYTSEIELREKTQYPPFGRLASILISAGDRHAAEGYARRLAALAPRDDEVRVLGPAEAPLAVVRGRHRFRLLVKSPRNLDLSAYMREWLAASPKHKSDIKLEVDIDPQSFL